MFKNLMSWLTAVRPMNIWLILVLIFGSVYGLARVMDDFIRRFSGENE